MRLNILNICLSILVFSSCSNIENYQSKSVIPENHSIDTNALLTLLNTQADEWNKGNIDGYMKGYWNSDSLRFIGKRGIRYGYDSVATMYKRHYDSKDKMGHLVFSSLSYNKLAYIPEIVNVCGKWNISGKDSAGGYFSLIMQPINGEWKITTDQTW